MKLLRVLFFTLLLIGGLNWGFIGLFQLDLVAKLFGDMTIMSRLIYALVGLSAVISAVAIYPMLGEEEE